MHDKRPGQEDDCDHDEVDAFACAADGCALQCVGGGQ